MNECASGPMGVANGSNLVGANVEQSGDLAEAVGRYNVRDQLIERLLIDFSLLSNSD
jgi:hypothetical protein